MRIGLAYDLKDRVLLDGAQPEDALEEYDSRETVEGIAAAIEAAGHSTVRLGGGRDFLDAVLREKVDFVFNIAEGLGNFRSREAQVPGVLEMLGIPYSGSDPQCLAICLDKPLTKKLVASTGVDTPGWRVITERQEARQLSRDGFPLPAFVKPAYEGSSKGVRFGSRVNSVEEMTQVAQRLLEHYRQPAMVEEFIAGDEITVGILGNSPAKVLGIMRVVPTTDSANFVYSLEVKRDWERLVSYECPAQLDARLLERIAHASLKAFEVLGCRDFARVDFRLNSDGVPYFLEINPLPGLNPVSGDYVIMARKMGWSYEGLISAILTAAMARYPRCAPG